MNKEKNTEVGKLLKATRKEQKLDLKEVSSAINVRVAQLEAIENGDIDELPGMVYAIGFVKSYANYLGLDSEYICKKFKREHGAAEPANTEINAEPSIKTQQNPSPKILIFSAIALIIVVIAWFFISGNGTDNENIVLEARIPEPPTHLVAKITNEEENKISEMKITNTKDDDIVVFENTTAKENSERQKTPTKLEKLKIAKKKPLKTSNIAKATGKIFGAPANKSRISMLAIASSWVHIKDINGKTVFRKVLRPGQVYRVPNKPGFIMTTANAGGLEIYVDGKKVAPFGKRGDIIRGIELDANKILKKNKL